MVKPEVLHPVWPKGEARDQWGNRLDAIAPSVRGYRYRDGVRYLAIVQEATAHLRDGDTRTTIQVLAVVYPESPALPDVLACHHAAHDYRNLARKEGGFDA